MKNGFNLLVLIVLLSIAQPLFAIPAGAVTPCGAPKPTDSTSLICQSTMAIVPFNGNNSVSLITTARTYCQTPANAPSLVAAYNAATTGPWNWYYNGNSNQNEIVQICMLTTTGGTFNQTCRSYRDLSFQTDYALPGFRSYLVNNTVTYSGPGTTLDGGYSVQSVNGIFTDYCNLQTDITVPSSHYMPAGCVSIYSNVAAYNICQSGLMENMPSCDLSGSVTSSTKYSTTAIPGFNLCYSSIGVSPFTPVQCSSISTSNSNGVYSEGCGTFASGQAESSHPTKQYVYMVVSPAVPLESILSVFFEAVFE